MKPRRGLTLTRFGSRSVRTPNASRSIGLSSGASRKRFPSTRAPYVSWRLLNILRESAQASAPDHRRPLASVEPNWRRKLYGRFSTTSASER